MSGRVAKLTKKINTVEMLKDLGSVNRFYLLQLIAQGYITLNDQKGVGRGRPRKVPVLTNKGRNLLNLSMNWFKPIEKNPEPEEVVM